MKKLHSHRAAWTLLAGLALLSLAATSRAADLRQTGRTLAKKYEMAIVNVRIVLTYQGNDRMMEASGTVISADGLTVVPLNDVDPLSFARRVRNTPEGGGANARVKEIKLIVNKRTEIPATVVLRDADLNIALLRPLQKPTSPMVFVDLAGTADAQMLDQVLVLARMGRVADREIGAMTGEIQAVVTKPRKFYIPSAELASGGYGVPIFDADTKLIGIVLIRVNVGAVDSQEDMVGIILPAKDLKDFAAQAPAEVPKNLPADEPATPASPASPAKPAKPVAKQPDAKLPLPN